MMATLVAIGLLVMLPQGASTAAASLEGYVREAGSREPIPNAFVVVSGASGNKATTSDEQGRFTVAGLAPGRYTLSAVADGFAVDPASASVAALTGGRTTTVDVAMTRAAVIAGEVRDEHGNLRGGVSVTVIRKPTAGGTEMPPLEPALTNERGEFRVGLLPPGEYLVLASPADKRTTDAAVMPTYYPSVTDQKSATAIPLVSGQTASGIVVTMQSVPAYEITGTVVDEQGRPARAMITFVAQSIQTWVPNQSAGLRVRVSALITKADGTFRITGLGPGSYRLTPLPAPDAPPQQLPMDVTLAAVNGNRSTQQVDVRDSSVTGVTVVFRSSAR